jgi:hypothetical protein
MVQCPARKLFKKASLITPSLIKLLLQTIVNHRSNKTASPSLRAILIINFADCANYKEKRKASKFQKEKFISENWGWIFSTEFFPSSFWFFIKMLNLKSIKIWWVFFSMIFYD